MKVKFILILGLFFFSIFQPCEAEVSIQNYQLHEIMIIPFDYSKDVRTQNQYSGLVEIIVEGIGQGAGQEWNDAFWWFNSETSYVKDNKGSPLRVSFTERPILPAGESITNFIVKIKDKEVIQGSKPEYNQTHHYRFTIDIGKEKCYIYFGNEDGGLSDNTGSYIIDIKPCNILVDVSLSDDRCNLGTTQEINFHLIWNNNGSGVINCLVNINGFDYVTNALGEITFKKYTSTIGEEKWIINGVKYNDITDYTFSITNPSIVWDRVLVSWLPYSKRVNVGTDVSRYLRGIYEYDGLGFQGQIFLNDTVKQNTGKYRYSIKGIEDSQYGLTAFSSDPAEFIFDRVNINLQVENPRIQVGRTPAITIQGFYEYDKTPFQGTVVVDNALISSDIGERSFTVSSINDSQYGLTAFTSNEATCIFDTILSEVEIDTNTPSKANVKVYLQYETDKTPVNDAEVSVNGVKADAVGDGVYSASFTTLSPSDEFKVSIKRDGFDLIESSYSVLATGNIALEGLLITIVIVGVALKIRSMRKRTREIHQNKLSKLEEYVKSRGRIEFLGASQDLGLEERDVRILLDALVNERRVKGYISKDDKGFVTEEKSIEEARRRLE